MSDVVPCKRRIPHWGWLFAAAVLIAVVLVAIFVGRPIYRLQQNVAYLRQAGIPIIVRVSDEPQWLPQWMGDDLRVVFSSCVEIKAVPRDFTDDELAYFEGLKNIEILKLHESQITDAGLIHLADLTNLQYLNLSYTQITDAGLIHLTRLTKLENLFLDRTSVTPAGTAKLKAALPGVLIDGE